MDDESGVSVSKSDYIPREDAGTKRVCLIGCGTISENHLGCIAAISGLQLVGVCDCIEARAKAKAEKYGCPWYTDYREMLRLLKPDSVHICLPHHLHAEAAIYALEAGIDVLCEKQMSSDYAGALRMAQAAERSGKRLGVIFQNRYLPGNRLVRQLIENGSVGRIECMTGRVCWKRDQVYYDQDPWRCFWKTSGGGVCVNQAIHTLDLLRYFACSEPVLTHASVSHHGETTVEVEDTAEGLIQFENGARALFWFTANNSYDEPIEIRIRCELAEIKLIAGEADILFSDGRRLNSRNMANEGPAVTGLKDVYGVGHGAQILDFYRDADGSRAKWMMREALATQKLLHDIYQSAGILHEE